MLNLNMKTNSLAVSVLYHVFIAIFWHAFILNLCLFMTKTHTL